MTPFRPEKNASFENMIDHVAIDHKISMIITTCTTIDALMNMLTSVMSGPFGSSAAAGGGGGGAVASAGGVIGNPSGPIAGGGGSVPGAAESVGAPGAGVPGAGAALPGVPGWVGCGAGCAIAAVTIIVRPSINPAAAAARAIVIRLPLLTVTLPITTNLPSCLARPAIPVLEPSSIRGTLPARCHKTLNLNGNQVRLDLRRHLGR